MAKMAATRSYRHPVVILRIILFALILDGTSFCINTLQFPSLILKLVSRHLYRRYIAISQRLFGSLLIVLVYLFSPAEIILSGDHKGLQANRFIVLMGNHQTYTDWWWLWNVAWARKAHGEVKIILKESLKWIPIIGWGMQFFEFIFLARKWAIDKAKLHYNLQRAQSDKLPLWLLIFPEGTVISPNTQAQSRAYAKKMGLSDDPKHVIIPKSTGLFFVLRSMQPQVTSLYDMTIGYDGLSADDCPEQVYTMGRVFFQGDGPRKIYIHARRFDVPSLPGFAPGKGSATSMSAAERVGNGEAETVDARAEAFNVWLRERWNEKDEMMKDFFADRSFRRAIEREGGDVRDQEVIKLVPTLGDWLSLAATCGVVGLGCGKLLGLV
ncbi:hypothetical protein HK104_010652 [Borealophlyctis nickersoniae]|nr:hypothetical protein HK104_010652 [Borealophlyctis nickersoniae]